MQVNPSNHITYDYIQKYQLDPTARTDIDFGLDGHTIHHLIPDKVSTSNPLCVEAMELIGYSPDRMTNYHEMPMQNLYRLLDGQEVGHWSHPSAIRKSSFRPFRTRITPWWRTSGPCTPGLSSIPASRRSARRCGMN